ncbi:hypothetical protein [Rubellimicrobium sp. CFH 75288]|uniref:hypothetical protein n=1 Tax=Rubellimicrobium sp. CFH 75288 TaxID=2697034 RepID=UPI0014135247|nr:hypothetical protein [Rubellimicrobium sp. CFH 75288]NAZ37156.1 hypothetical protein [Rubellimicrobium sp. CFH 75288]
MPALLKSLTIDEISLVDEPANDEARVVIIKARRPFDLAPGGAKPQETTMPDMDAIEAALAEAEQTITALTKARDEAEEERDDAKARIAEIEEEIAALQAELEEAKGEVEKARRAALAPEEAEEAFLKSLPEPARRRLVEAEAELAKARAREEEQAAIAKARAFAPGEEEARRLGGLLLRIEKGRTTPEDAAAVEQILKSARAIDARSLFFKALGSGGGQAEDDPERALQAKADEIAKARPDLSRAAAYAEAVQQNPDLYGAYVAKRRATIPAIV